MSTSIKKIAVIGTGVIGTGWTLRFLAYNKEVYVFDPNLKQKEFLKNEFNRTRVFLKKFHKSKKILFKQIF